MVNLIHEELPFDAPSKDKCRIDWSLTKYLFN